jgi:hypothetical protein
MFAPILTRPMLRMKGEVDLRLWLCAQGFSSEEPVERCGQTRLRLLDFELAVQGHHSVLHHGASYLLQGPLELPHVAERPLSVWKGTLSNASDVQQIVVVFNQDKATLFHQPDLGSVQRRSGTTVAIKSCH